MADVSLAAMAGATAADHERISKNCPAKTRVWVCDDHIPPIGTAWGRGQQEVA